MSSSFDADKVSRVSSGLFDNDGFLGFDSQPSSNAYAAFAAGDADDPIRISSGGIGLPDGASFSRQEFISPASPFPIPYSNGNGFGEAAANDGVFVSDGPILPTPSEMQPDEGFFLREWRRQNAMLLEEKEMVEKELREQIIIEADEYKIAYHEMQKVTSETNRTQNREREKLFLANQEKFHASADKDWWKAIAELIPNEVPNIQQKRAKKEQERKPSIAVIQGPNPGKPTDLSRMRQLLVKLKHNPPPHVNTSAAAPAQVVVDAPTKPPASKEVVVIA